MTSADLTSRDLDRSIKTPSPLSCWTKVFPELPEDGKRRVFTILPDENADNSPRLPQPELTRLEAKGMVSLSSDWPQARDRIDVGITTNNTKHDRRPKTQKPIQMPTSVNCSRFKPVSKEVHDNSDEEIVIVTDKTTQTKQPWPFVQQTSLEDNIEGDSFDQMLNFSISQHNSNNNNTSSNTNSDSTHIDNTHSNNEGYGDIHTTNDVPSNSECFSSNDKHHQPNIFDDDVNSTEAPTLKVEYVGKIWDAYVNDFLLASDHISEAAIYDRATKSCIACSPDFSMTEGEFAHLQTGLSSLSVAYRCGVKINNRYFKTILADGRRGLMAKGAENDGCSACQTRTLILIAVHDRRAKGRRCNEELMRLGDFFWAKGL